jgi:hypothetical protein
VRELLFACKHCVHESIHEAMIKSELLPSFYAASEVKAEKEGKGKFPNAIFIIQEG